MICTRFSWTYRLVAYGLLFAQIFLCHADRDVPRRSKIKIDYDSRKELQLFGENDPYNFDYSCERIDVSYCQNQGYNFTRMPNTFGHIRQHLAKMQLDTFEALVDVNCSTELQFFLCAVYLPMCDSRLKHDMQDLVVLPCQGWCRAEESKCTKFMKTVDLDWPSALNCSQFLPYNGYEGLMCMEGPMREQPQTTSLTITPPVEKDLCR